MTKLWHRHRPYLQPTDDELAALLDTTIGRDDVTDSTVLTDGRFNTNLRVDFAVGAPVVIRIYERDPSVQQLEAAVIDAVADHVPTARVLSSIEEPSSSLPADIADALPGHPMTVFQWLEGESPTVLLEQLDDQNGRRLAGQIGATLAGIHSAVQFDAPGLLDPDLTLRRRFASNRTAFVDFIDWSLSRGGAGEHLDEALKQRLRDTVDAEAHLLDATEGDCRLVHGDFRLSNLLARRKSSGWTIIGVVDWELARSSTPVYDLAVLLRHCDRWPFGFADAVATGYRTAGGELPTQWRRLAELVDLQQLCGMLNGSSTRRRTIDAVSRRIATIVG